MAIGVWLCCAGSMLGGLTSSASASAVAQARPSTWPEGAGPSLDPERLTLVMWVHPQCPCTHAAARDLVELLAYAGDRVRPIVLVARPADASADWTSTGAVGEIAALPGVEVVADDGEVQARFGATTSGEMQVFAPSGERLFAGMPTAESHAGQDTDEHAGTAAMEAFARGLGNALARVATDGCALPSA